MSVVCGIDLGSPTGLSYVAFLKDTQFYFTAYVPTPQQPLPPVPSAWPEPQCTLVDGPQSLPAKGRTRRAADEAANTPTRVLPPDRKALEETKIYRGLIQNGIDIFWWAYESGRYTIPGLEKRGPILGETYPSFVLKQQFPGLYKKVKERLKEEKKKKANSLSYSQVIWEALLANGFTCPGVLLPTADQVDAALAAFTALIYLNNGQPAHMHYGEAPTVDKKAHVLREGFLVAPYAH
jgi:predicted nuclease with RNAse H fold